MNNFKITLSASAKEALTFLIILLCVYAVLIGGLAAVCQTFDLGFAYVGFFIIAGIVSLACCSGNDAKS